MFSDTGKDILGVLFVITSIFDSVKYHWNAAKIRKYQSARGHSRKFINVAILNDIMKMGYSLSIGDLYIFLSSLLAIICMFELFFMIYWYYPYKYKNLLNFKRPNVFKYLWNSLLPNKLTKRL